MALPAFVAPARIASTFRHLSRRPTLRLTPFRPLYDDLSRVSPLTPGIPQLSPLRESRRRSGLQPTHRPRTNWHRHKLPLYNRNLSVEKLGRITPLNTQSLRFHHERDTEINGFTPRISIRPVAHHRQMALNAAIAMGTYYYPSDYPRRTHGRAQTQPLPEAIAYVTHPNDLRPELNRRRKDQKVEDGYRRIHVAANSISQAVRDPAKSALISDLWFANRDPAAFLTGLAYFNALEDEDYNYSRQILRDLYPNIR